MYGPGGVSGERNPLLPGYEKKAGEPASKVILPVRGASSVDQKSPECPWFGWIVKVKTAWEGFKAKLSSLQESNSPSLQNRSVSVLQPSTAQDEELAAISDSRAPPSPPVSLHTLITQLDELGIERYLQNAGMSEEAAKTLSLTMVSSDWNLPKRFLSDDNALLNRVTGPIEIENQVSQAALIEIVKWCAQKCPAALPYHMDKFGITKQTALIEIAKLCSQQSVWAANEVALNISKFKITGQKDLIDVLESCVNTTPTALGYFKNFGITDQSVLIEFIRLYVDRHGAKIAKYIGEFGITDQSFLIEIAKLCACQNGEKIAADIGEFGIIDQAALIEIAKLCARQNGARTAAYISNFKITDQAALIQIAKLCAHKHPVAVILYMDEFGIADKTAFRVIELLCFMKCLSMDKLRRQDKDQLSAFVREGLEPSGGKGPILTFLEQELVTCQESGPATVRYQLHYLMVLYLKEETGVSGIGELGKEVESTFLKILDVRNNSLQIFLVESLAKMVKTPSLREQFLPIVANGKFNYALPLLLLSTEIMEEAGSLGFTEEQRKHLEQEKLLIQTTLATLRHDLKSSGTGLMIQFLKMLQNLQSTNLSPQQKASLFVSLCRAVKGVEGSTKIQFPKDFATALNYMNVLFELGVLTDNLPDALKAAFSFKELKSVSMGHAQQALLGTTVLTAEQKKLFEPQYLRLQEEQRRPVALELYARRIRSLNDAPLAAAMDRFVLNVLGGTSSAQRYADVNPHTKTLRDNHPMVWKKWMQLPPPQPLVLEARSPQSVSITDDWQDLFLCGTEVLSSCQALDGDLKLNKCLLSYCMDGKTQMVAIKEVSSGKIIARAILKLLLHKKTDGELIPALFLERIYSGSHLSKEQEDALKTMALERAKDLGLNLYTEMSGIKKEDAILQSLGTSSPYEYEDAKGMGISNGEYEFTANEVMSLSTFQKS